MNHNNYQTFHIVRVTYLFLLAFSIFCFDYQSTYATSYSVVKSIAMSETAKNATIAKNKAIEFGKRRAFDEIVRAIEPEINNNSLIKISNKEIQNAIISISILHEIIKKNSYECILEYSFNYQMLNNLLRRVLKNRKEKSTMIIPILRNGDSISVWDSDWYSIWTSFSNKKISIINESINDFDFISSIDLQNYDRFSDKKIKEHYNVDEVFLIQLEYQTENTILITIINNNYHNIKKIHYEIINEDADNLHSVFKKLATTAFEEIATLNSRYINDLRMVKEYKTKHIIVIKDLTDWRFIEDNALKNLEYNIKYLSNNFMLIELKWEDDARSVEEYFDSIKNISALSYTGLLELKRKQSSILSNTK